MPVKEANDLFLKKIYQQYSACDCLIPFAASAPVRGTLSEEVLYL